MSEGKGRRRNSGVWFAFWGFRGEPRLVGGVNGVCALCDGRGRPSIEEKWRRVGFCWDPNASSSMKAFSLRHRTN